MYFLFKKYKYVFVFALTLMMLFSMSLTVQSAEDFPIMEVTKGGTTSVSAIFKNAVLYPGCDPATGYMRIINKSGDKITINNIGMTISYAENYTAERKVDYEDKMLIKVSYKNILESALKGDIFKGENDGYGTFGDFADGGANCSISLLPNQEIDLIYTIKMSESATTLVAGVKGNINFTVNVGFEEQGNKGGNGDSNGGEKKETKITDLDKDHWAHDCITTLISHKIIEVDANGAIRPDDPITRAETAVLMGKTLGLEPKDKFFSGYLDPLPKWARGYIIATSDAKVFRGYPGFLFKPNNKITREELICVFVRTFDKKLDPDLTLGFLDKGDISEWALEDVKAGVLHNVIVGYPDNTYKPQNDITRAEAFTIVCKLLGLYEKH